MKGQFLAALDERCLPTKTANLRPFPLRHNGSEPACLDQGNLGSGMKD
jgi:hypothetical protein